MKPTPNNSFLSLASLVTLAILVACHQSAGATDYTWKSTNPTNADWDVTGNWSVAGYPSLAGDTAIFSQDFTATFGVDLNSGVLGSNAILINSLSVTDTTTSSAYDLNINNGTGTPSITLNGATPTITAALASSKALNITPTINLNTANAVFTKAGAASLNIINPGTSFFSNLNPAAGLTVSEGTLRIQKVAAGINGMSSGLKTGAGSLQLDLTNTSTFFQSHATVGGTGTRIITNVRSFADGSTNPQTLINNSSDRLEIRLEPTTTSTFLSSFAGISSIAGKSGTVLLNNFTGTIDLGSKSFDTSVGAAQLILSGNGGTASAAVLNGGSFNTGTKSLVLGEGVTLNVDSNTGTFNIGGELIISSGNGNNPSSGGDATVNWNATGKTLTGTLNFAVQGGGIATFNMQGGSLTAGNGVLMGSTSHDYDSSTSVLNITDGTLTVASAKNFTMSSVSTDGGKEVSSLNISGTGVLDLTSANTISLGPRSGTTKSTISDATINLDGGTLKVGKALARQAVAANVIAGSSATVQFYFNGGTLQAGANITDLFTGFGTANSDNDGVFVKSGGAVIDTSVFSVGITSAPLVFAPSGTGGLTKLGAGTLTLGASNTYTGATAVRDGTLALGTGNDRLPTGTSLTLGDGSANTSGILKLDSRSQTLAGLLTAGTGTANKVVNGNATAAELTLNIAGGTNTFSGILGGGGTNENNFGLTKSGGGILELTAGSTFTGSVTLGGGTLKLSGATATQIASSSGVTFTASGTLDLNGSAKTLKNLQFANAGTTGTVTNGDLTLTGDNNLSLVPAGLATAGNTITLDMSGLTSFTYNNAARPMQVGVSLLFNNKADVSLAGGTNTITASTLSMANGGDGTYPFNSGTLRLGQTNVLNLGTGSNEAIRLSGYRSGGNVITFQAGLTNPTLKVRASDGTSRAGDVVVSEASSGTNVTSPINGDFDMGVADIKVRNVLVASTVQTGSGVTVNGSMTLRGGTFDATSVNLGYVNTTGASTNINGLNATFTHNAGTSLIGTLTMGDTASTAGTPTGTLAIFNPTYALVSGTLSAETINANPGGKAFRSTSSRKIDWSSGTITNYNDGAGDVRDLSIDGTTGTGGALAINLLTAGTHTLNADAGKTVTIGSNATLAGAGALNKTGDGTLVLQGTNTYTGTTTVSSGKLELTGSGSIASSSKIVVGDGATLDVDSVTDGVWTVTAGQTLKGHNGTVLASSLSGQGVVFAADPDGAGSQTGGIHAPGNSLGLQTINGNVAYNSGSIFEWELGATLKDSDISGALRATDWDAVNVSGALATTGTGAIFRVVLDGATTFADSFWNESRKWTDIFKTSDTGALVSFESIFANFQHYNYSGAGGTLNDLGDVSSRGSFSITGGTTLTWTAVPEPTTALAGILLTAGLLRRRRGK